jgi:hypothetical protein
MSLDTNITNPNPDIDYCEACQIMANGGIGYYTIGIFHTCEKRFNESNEIKKYRKQFKKEDKPL